MNTAAEDPKIFFSVVIPAHNEEESIADTVRAITGYLDGKAVTDYEVLVVNDNSGDGTERVLLELERKLPRLRHVNNKPPNGFGFAIRRGLAEFRGACVCIVMADLSDAPEDIYSYYLALKSGHECVFGSRFVKGGRVLDYPLPKLILNRLANLFIKTLFGIPHNDITNAFKAYRREVIEGAMPILSCHFNLTVELPLKAIARGYSFTTIPISWTNRVHGISKLRIKEMGSRYLFIVLYIWLEKKLARGDYMRIKSVRPSSVSDRPFKEPAA